MTWFLIINTRSKTGYFTIKPIYNLIKIENAQHKLNRIYSNLLNYNITILKRIGEQR